MDVSENSGFSPKSSILIGFSIINHPFWGTPIFGKHPYISFGQHHFEWLVHRGHSQVPWNPLRSATNWPRKFTHWKPQMKVDSRSSVSLQVDLQVLCSFSGH